MSSYQLHFVGADRLPRTLSEFDVARFFSLLPDDAKEIEERFRADRRLGVAVQFVFLRASGRPMNQLACSEGPTRLFRGLSNNYPQAVVLLGVVV